MQISPSVYPFASHPCQWAGHMQLPTSNFNQPWSEDVYAPQSRTVILEVYKATVPHTCIVCGCGCCVCYIRIWWMCWEGGGGGGRYVHTCLGTIRQSSSRVFKILLSSRAINRAEGGKRLQPRSKLPEALGWEFRAVGPIWAHIL
jgi:hypothetical protein